MSSSAAVPRRAAAPVRRTLPASAGALLLGSGEIGSLPLRTPELLWSSTRADSDAGAPEGVQLVSGTVLPTGQRELILRRAPGELRLRFPVPTPEITGVPGLWQETGAGVAYIHAPLTGAQWAELRRGHPNLVVLGNARALWQDGAPFVETLWEVRSQLGA